MAQITYADKVALNENPNVNAINKIRDEDMNEIKEIVNKNTPVGSIMLYTGSTPPDGWLICNGTGVSRTLYADLFALIGTTYGAGDGSTTFNLPNLRGKVPVGYDSSQTEFNAFGKTGGEKTHTLTTNEMPSHSHGIGYAVTAAAGSASAIMSYQPSGTFASNSAGGDAAHNNLQPYIVLNYIIAY